MTARLRELPTQLTIRAKLALITAVLVAVIGGIIFISARSTKADHDRVVVNNVAGRQPMLVHRYFEEVLLVTVGGTADPHGTMDGLIHDSDALLDGGAVLAVQGNDNEIHLSAQTDSTVRAKLTEFRRLVGELSTAGDRVLQDQPGTPAYLDDVAKAEALVHVTANVGHDAVGRMTTVEDTRVGDNATIQIVLAAIGIVLALALSWLLGRQLVRRLRGLVDVAHRTASGDLHSRFPITTHDEIGTLGVAFNEMTDSLSGVLGKLEADAARDAFGNQLADALEMAEDEAATYAVIERAMAQVASDRKMELLLADSSRAHLKQVAKSPSAGSPGCTVESPFSCVAVRRGRATTFETSTALNACPKLRDREDGDCSAVCVPVSFMGKSLGVLHVTGPDRQRPSEEQVVRLTTLAAQASSRIGTVRAFSQTQLQATTDGLTGLINRRTLENELRGLLLDGTPFALAMADLDRFKQLNDTFGHEGGDRALRLFSRTVRDAVRAGDLVARYGGEEFVFVFPGLNADSASELLERLRVILAGTLASGDAPAFTASYGVTDTTAASTIDDLLRIADEALMTAKRDGRDRVVTAVSPQAVAPAP